MLATSLLQTIHTSMPTLTDASAPLSEAFFQYSPAASGTNNATRLSELDCSASRKILDSRPAMRAEQSATPSTLRRMMRSNCRSVRLEK